eukprot:2504482-Amphidinium_carterae.1
MLCVHLAECEYGSLRAKFQLPGCKVRGHESAEDAIRRLLKERLHGMAAAIRLTRSQVVVESQPQLDSACFMGAGDTQDEVLKLVT